MTSIEDILASARLRESSVDLFMRGDLVAEYEQLDNALADASSTTTNLGDVSPKAQIAARMQELGEEMESSQVKFLIRAMPALKWSNYAGTQPAVPADDADEETVAAFGEAAHIWTCDLVSRCCYDPEMTIDQVNRLSDVITDAQWRQLVDVCWTVNKGTQSIPFSVAAYAHRPVTEPKRKRPTRSASRARSSSAGSEPK